MKLLRLAAIMAALMPSIAVAQTGSLKTTTQLNAEVNSLWIDNTTGGITPFNARQTLLDLIASTSNLQGTSPQAYSFGGCAALTPPTQTTPVFGMLNVCGSYADSGAGNIFQIGSWADNTGTRNMVAIFGQGRALGTSGRAWGGNFVGYAGATGAFAQATEIDFGVANGISAQQAWGIAINAGGTTGSPGSNTVLGINFDSLGTGGVMTNAIRFNNQGLAQPYQNALIVTGNSGGAITAPFGIDFSNASFATAAIKTKNYVLDPNGNITSAGTMVSGVNGGTGGQLTLNGATSGSIVKSVSATGSVDQLNVGANATLNTSNVAGYNLVSTNGVNTGNGGLGFFGGATGDGALYFISPAGGAFQWRFNNVQSMLLNSVGHFNFTGSAVPTLTAGCNGAGSSVSGTDVSGTVTGQTAAATTCTLTWGTAFVGAPNCIPVGLSSPLTGAVTTGTGTMVVNFASTANYKFAYFCPGA